MPDPGEAPVFSLLPYCLLSQTNDQKGNFHTYHQPTVRQWANIEKSWGCIVGNVQGKKKKKFYFVKFQLLGLNDV